MKKKIIALILAAVTAISLMGCGNTNTNTQEAAETQDQTAAEGSAEADTGAEVHQVFHDNVTCVFCSGETGFNHCEACLHEEDKRGANKHPDCVYC